MKLETFSKNERSLLLYFESRAVDHSGAVHTQHMNAEDMQLAALWHDNGFVRFGRISSDCLPMPSGSTHWCELSESAWLLAAEERRSRYLRGFANRRWTSTEEKRSA